MPRFGKGFTLGRLLRLVQGFKRHPADNPLASTCLEKSYSFTRISLDLRVEGGWGWKQFFNDKDLWGESLCSGKGFKGFTQVDSGL